MTHPAHGCLTLAFTPGLGPRKIKSLIEHFGSAADTLQAHPDALHEVEGIGPKIVAALQAAKPSDRALQELERARKLNVTLLPLDSPNYPTALRQIYDPPAVLYVRGQLPQALHQAFDALRALGVVGTRDASPYALTLTRKLATELATQGVVITSGLALGVDTAAHEGALAAPDGQTVAVLGSGVDVIYPSQNQNLAKRIIQGGGAVVSEYPLGTSPRAENFPGRNRIINGLSRGIIVVEAGKKSGALITAEYAAEEGRTVFAIPGQVGDPRAHGTLELLKQGAVLTTSSQDIIDEFGWQKDSPAVTEPRITAPPPALTATEQDIVDAIKRLGSPTLDDLAHAANLTASAILPVLMRLELRGFVRTLPGGRYGLGLGIGLP